MHSLSILVLLGIALGVGLQVAHHAVDAISVTRFYQFGDSVGDSVLARNDDGASPAIPIDFSFFESRQTSIYVNNNGLLSFGANMTGFTPQPIPIPGNTIPFLSPFWADVDTRPSDGGFVYYREITSSTNSSTDLSLMLRARNHIRNRFIGFSQFTPTWLFIATWYRVGYYSERTDKTNTFQSVLTTDGTYSFVSFLYANGLIQWTTGEASGGIDGLGGSPAQCGFDAGDQTRFFAHPASRTAAIINIALTTNINIFGLWSFRVDGGNIAQPEILIGSDPHFAIRLSEGKLLCYSFQGRRNTIFNLLGNDHLQMNALFVPDDTNWDNTWLGSIGIAVLHNGRKMMTLQFIAAHHQIVVGERVTLDANAIEKLSFYKGKLTMHKILSNRTRKYPRVQVEFVDSKLDFIIGFTKDNHLDLYWHSTGIPSKSSTGVVGQFFHDGVNIDVDAQLLHMPGHPPVPVEKRDLWKFMSKSLVSDHECWTSAYPSSQGAGVVAGTYEDYIVDDLLAAGRQGQ